MAELKSRSDRHRLEVGIFTAIDGQVGMYFPALGIAGPTPGQPEGEQRARLQVAGGHLPLGSVDDERHIRDGFVHLAGRLPFTVLK